MGVDGDTVTEVAEPKNVENFTWDVDMEVQLFYAMSGHKPVGINKYFHMAGIWDKLSNSIAREISTSDIWRHLDTLYDIQMLDETEPIPFPNNEVDFSLPQDEFGTLLRQKYKEAILNEDIEVSLFTESAPSPKATPTPKSSSRGASSKDNTPKSVLGKRDQRISDKSGSGTEIERKKTRKESGGSNADSTTSKHERDSVWSKSDRRRDSRDSTVSLGVGSGRSTPAPASSGGTVGRPPKKDRNKTRTSNSGSEKGEDKAPRGGSPQSSPGRGRPRTRPTRNSLRTEETPAPTPRKRRI